MNSSQIAPRCRRNYHVGIITALAALAFGSALSQQVVGRSPAAETTMSASPPRTTGASLATVDGSNVSRSPVSMDSSPSNTVKANSASAFKSSDSLLVDDNSSRIPVDLTSNLDADARPTEKISAGTAGLGSGVARVSRRPEISTQLLPAIVLPRGTDLSTAAGHHYPTHGGHYGGHHNAKHHGSKYFQYANVAHPSVWDAGYRRGNSHHTIERYEHRKGPHSFTKVKWADKNGRYGVQVWDFNHVDHHSHHYGGYPDSHGPAHHGYGAGRQRGRHYSQHGGYGHY